MISNEKNARQKKKHGETTAWKIEDGIRKGIVFKDGYFFRISCENFGAVSGL